MKSNIKIVIAFILGIIVTSSVVYASGIMASSIGYKDGTVEDALDDLYSVPQAKKFCELKDGTALTVGSKYECDPGDGVKRNFYVLSINNSSLNLIMEKNITSDTEGITWNAAMDYIRANNLKTSWKDVLDIDLPSAQDIANAVLNTNWKVASAGENDWFYLDKNGNTYGQTQVATSINKSNYAWLYNHTRNCQAYGCTSTDTVSTVDSGNNYGYWTRDMVNGTTNYVWAVRRPGNLGYGSSSEAIHGFRPVITVLKSNLYE